MNTKSFTKHFVSAVLALALGETLQAQPTPVPPASGQVGLSLSSELTSSGPARLKGGDTSYSGVAISNAAMTIGQNIPLSENHSLTIGLGYDLTNIKVEEPAGWQDDNYWKSYKRDHPNWDHIPLPSELKTVALSISHSLKVDDQWSLYSSVAAGSHVAKTGLLSKGWGLSASIMGLYAWDSSLTFAVGLAYDSLSHDFPLVPFLGLDWHPTEKWSVAIGFPKTSITYAFTKKLALSLAATGSGGTYFVKDDPLPGTASRSLSGSKLEFMEARLGIKLDRKINNTFAITATIGQVLYREFKYIDRNYKLRSRDAVPFSTIGGTISF